MFIQQFNQKLDFDMALISQQCTGRQALSCSICAFLLIPLTSTKKNHHPVLTTPEKDNKLLRGQTPKIRVPKTEML